MTQRGTNFDLELKLEQNVPLQFLKFYVCGCFACMYVHHVCAVPMEAKRGHLIHWNWRYTWFEAPCNVLGTEPWSSGRVSSALVCCAISSLAVAMVCYVLETLPLNRKEWKRVCSENSGWCMYHLLLSDQ